MAKVSIRVQSGDVRFDVAGTTDIPERATGLIRDSYRAGDIRLRLPTDLERFPNRPHLRNEGARFPADSRPGDLLGEDAQNGVERGRDDLS